jgi:hypothetical protein
MAQGIPLFVAFLVVLFFPSANLQIFDGLPISTLPEFAVLALAVPFLLFRELRVRQADCWKRWKIRPIWLWTILAAVLVIKIVLFASGEHSGFAGCYRSDAQPTAITHEDLPYRMCERSYENLFDRFSATRLDKKIWFGEDGWNLVFVNTNRYDFYEWEPGNILRARIPIEARWRGDPDIPAGVPIRIEYVGEGTVAWGEVRIDLPPSYTEPAVVDIRAPSAESLLQIAYVFNDGSRSGQDPADWGPRASIKVGKYENGKAIPLSARGAAAGWRIAALLADGLIFLWVISCIPALISSARENAIILVLFSAGLAALYWIPLPVIVCEISVAMALAAVFFIHLAVQPLRPASMYYCVLAAAFLVLVVWSSGFGQVILRSAGNDPLQYESQSYSILATGSLRAGESTFYFQPGYRYVRFAEHVVFGDGNTFSFVAALALFWGGIAWIFDKTRKAAFPLWKRVILVLAMAFLVFLGGAYVSGAIREGLSEYSTWILLLYALPLLLLEEVGIGTILAFLAMALSVTIRVNQLPAVVWLLALAAVGIGRRGRRVLAIAIFGAAAIILLPLGHNLYYGHSAVLFTQGATSSVLMAVPPDVWFSYLGGSSAAAAAVAKQVNALFLNVWVPDTQRPIIAAMAALFVCWLAACVVSVVKRSWRDWAVLSLPLFFLAPHLVYNVDGYYPKYIFIAYMCMGAILPIVWLRASPKKEMTSSNPRPE